MLFVKMCYSYNWKKKLFMNKIPYLVLLILEISNMVMYVSWYDYVKPKYEEKTKLCSMETENVLVYSKIEIILKDDKKDFILLIMSCLQTITEIKKKVIELKQNGVYGKIMTSFAALIAKSFQF